MVRLAATLAALHLMVSPLAVPKPRDSTWWPGDAPEYTAAPVADDSFDPEVAIPEVAGVQADMQASGSVAMAQSYVIEAPAGEVVTVPLEFAAPASEPPDVPTLIRDAAERYGLDADRMLRIAWCESRWDPSARGAGGAAGLFQFVPLTWFATTQRMGLDGASPYDPSANAEAAAWLMATEGPHHWACK